VFELMEMNLYEWIKNKKTYLPENKIKAYTYQLLKAIEHTHANGIFHRDIKPENVLISSDVLKLADLGSCKSISSRQPYTEYISTRWYRPPECLLTDGYYGPKMDLWGVGCVLFEIIALYPLFPGKNELDQIKKIHNIIGTPSPGLFDRFQKHATHMEIKFPAKEGTGIDSLIPHAPELCRDLIKKLLIYEEDERITASQALSHQYFKEFRDEVSVVSHTPSITDSDFAAGEKEGKPQKKFFPVINKTVKNTSFSKISLGLDKTGSKILPVLKNSPMNAKKSVFKGYY
jgi:renal tumor antigen